MLVKWRTLSKYSYGIKSPLDLKIFLNDQKLHVVRQSMKKRFRDEKIADKISSKLQNHKKSLFNLEQLNKQINLTQKQIKEMMKSQQQEKFKISNLKEQIKSQKAKKKQLEESLNILGSEIQILIQKVGNIVHPMVPVSQNQQQNKVIRTYQSTKKKQHSHSYSEICEKANITDLTRGQKVSGHRGYFLKANGLKIALGLTQYAIQFLQNKGYALLQTPAIINQETLKGSCQLQSFAEDVYCLDGTFKESEKENKPNSYLIATSEQALAGYYQGQVLSKNELPVRLGGYSTCFRKEAGAHGKDIHGLFRVHQFQKVQQFSITEGDQQKSQIQMQRMISISEQFYQSLEIPYRVVNIVSGELNDAASCKYDLEGWFPSQKKYRQLVSVSNCLDYQSRLLGVQYLNTNNQLKHVHMLNGTLIAIQRTITCLLQNYYENDHIKIPNVLKPYIRCDSFPIKSTNKL